jgi:CRISPR system Cascade subunit CasE
VGQTFRFRLAANPTKRLRGDGKNDGNRIGLEREEDQLKWLSRKSDLHGFRVLAARTAKINQPDGCKVVNGKKQHIRQFAVRFDGILQVTDAEAFSLACRQGIGSGKGMGFGLLSLASA